jgi:hypothetical protein
VHNILEKPSEKGRQVCFNIFAAAAENSALVKQKTADNKKKSLRERWF